MTNEPIWSHRLEAPARGLSLAREAQRLLIWTDNSLLLLNRKGERQAQVRFPAPISAAAISEDGKVIVAATEDGKVAWLAQDLTSRWEQKIKGKPTAVALDPLGALAAVADNKSRLVFLEPDGNKFCETSGPRPIRHLAFVPGASSLLAAADFGWIGRFEIETHLWTWRDTPVSDTGNLSVAGVGEPICLACFSEGIRAYRADGAPWAFSTPFAPCRFVCLNYDASLFAILQVDGAISGCSIDQQPVFNYRPEASVVAMALTAVGDVLYVASSDRQVVAVSVKDAGVHR